MIQYEVSDGVCVLRLNCPPLNTLTYPVLDDLCEAIERAEGDSTVRAVVLIGSAKHFSAGADVGLFEKIVDRDDAVRVSRVFQEAFGRVEDCTKPIVAAVGGKVLGGALELAMACHWRVCTDDTRFAMPEVNLGINPGAGGTARLPRLVGAEASLQMLLSGRPIDARRAMKLGLVDAMATGDTLLEEAKRFALEAEGPRKTRSREDMICDAEANASAIEKARVKAAATRPEIIAPRNIVETVREGLEDSFAAGLLAEQESFAACMETTATRNKICLFFATRKTGKLEQAPAKSEAARSISKVAVIGGGSMGTGIAHAMIIGGLTTVIHDQDPAATQKAIEKIERSANKRVADGKLAQSRAEDMLGLLSSAESFDELSDADLAVEAVFEDVGVKQEVLRRIEAVCSPETVIATNTSTISLDTLAEGLNSPERLLGMHFFNPAQRMPLVEVIRRRETPSELIAGVLKFCGRIRKTPVLVDNREGFLVNRIFLPYLKEAFWLLEEGAVAEDIDAAMVEFGFPMGPLTLIDMAGLDILAATDGVLQKTFAHHGPLSPIVTQLVERGRLGQKTGGGVYDYRRGDYTSLHSEDADDVIQSVRRKSDVRPRDIDREEITRRLVLRMVAEAFRVLEEGIAQRESDIDVAMVLGTGFPDFRGGVLRYARDLGVDDVVRQLRELEQQFGERFAPREVT